MYPVSDKFKAAVKHSHKVVAKCEVYSGTDLLATLPITGGSVNVDSEGATRRRCTVRLDGTDHVPAETTGILHTNSNNELKVYRGIEFTDGTSELVPLGVFGIENTDIDDSGEGVSITVKGFDRSKELQRRRFTEVYYVDEGTNYATAIKDLINYKMPGLQYAFTTTTHTTPSMIFGTGGWSGGGDPWEKATEMASNIGMELFFDNNGIVTLRPEPDPTVDPVVWEYAEGPESMLLYLNRGISKENVFNHVVVIGNHSGLFAPIRADALDDNVNSPTYYLGPFGDVPTFHLSTMIFSQAQAEEVADAQLRKHLGTPESMRFISIVNPAHDVGDSVRVKRARINVNSVHVLDKLNIPLEYNGSINASARERRV